jgi:uncharacterized protein (DUF2267 family)
MSASKVDSIDRTVHKTNEWIAQLADELGTSDRETAWRVLKAYLQVLRDRLTIDEGAQLAAQLPVLLRGAFYEGFDPGHQPEPIRDRETFLRHFADRALLSDADEAEHAAAAATRVLRRHVTEGEFDDVLAQLPRDIRAVLEHA